MRAAKSVDEHPFQYRRSVDTKFVYTNSVKRITFRADQDLIDKARAIARLRGTTLNESFREWLAGFIATGDAAQGYRELMKSLRYVQPGRRFTRSEMNER